MAEDFTGRCLKDVQSKVAEFREQDLRQSFCVNCRNPECGYASPFANPWEERMATQVDRLLTNPRFADTLDPKWSYLKEMDFPDLFRKSVRLHLANKRGDWSLPTTAEVDAAMGVAPDSSRTQQDDTVEKAVQALKSLHTVIQIHSKTQPGITYDVVVDGEGQSLSCSCVAGKHGRRCTHRIWAEQEFRDRQRSVPDPVEEPPRGTERESKEDPEEEPLPLLGVRREPPGASQAPFQGLAKNTALPSHGVLLEGAPADAGPTGTT